MGNPVTWFEVNGPEPEQTAKFYSEVFGWHTETVPGNYILIDTHSGAGMNGGIGQTREGQPPHSVFFVENPDIQKLLDFRLVDTMDEVLQIAMEREVPPKVDKEFDKDVNKGLPGSVTH